MHMGLLWMRAGLQQVAVRASVVSLLSCLARHDEAVDKDSINA